MVLPPQLSGNRNSPGDVTIDVERDKVDITPGHMQSDRSSNFSHGPVDAFLRGLKNVTVAIGALVIIAIIVVGIIDPETTTDQPQEPEMAELFVAPNQADAAPQEDAWTPLMLCEDEQILETLVALRRQRLEVLLHDMAADGSYILPATGDPIAEGAARASIAFPEGTLALGMSETGGDALSDAMLVRCTGTMEIRDAFKLPDCPSSAPLAQFAA